MAYFFYSALASVFSTHHAKDLNGKGDYPHQRVKRARYSHDKTKCEKVITRYEVLDLGFDFTEDYIIWGRKLTSISKTNPDSELVFGISADSDPKVISEHNQEFDKLMKTDKAHNVETILLSETRDRNGTPKT